MLRTRAGEMTEAICHTSINVVPSGRNLAPLIHAILDFFEDRQLIPILVALGGNFLRKASETDPVSRDIIRLVKQADNVIPEADIHEVVCFQRYAGVKGIANHFDDSIVVFMVNTRSLFVKSLIVVK